VSASLPDGVGVTERQTRLRWTRPLARLHDTNGCCDSVLAPYRMARVSHKASNASPQSHATVSTPPSPIINTPSKPTRWGGRFSRTAASRVEPRSTVSLGGIRPLPCGGLGQELKRTRPPKVTEIHRMGEGHRAASISSGGGGRSRPVSPPPQYRHVGPLRGNDGTSDPNRPQSTP
jgi:hypothetical protein